MGRSSIWQLNWTIGKWIIFWQEDRVIKNNIRNERRYCISFLLLPWQVAIYLALCFKTKLICHFTEASVDQMSGWPQLVLCLGSHKAEIKVSEDFCSLWKAWGKVFSQIHADYWPSWDPPGHRIISSAFQSGGQSLLLDTDLIPSQAFPGASLKQYQVKCLLNLESFWIFLLSPARKCCFQYLEWLHCVMYWFDKISNTLVSDKKLSCF